RAITCYPGFYHVLSTWTPHPPLFLFSFSLRSADHPDIHSFPTRRSSDLLIDQPRDRIFTCPAFACVIGDDSQQGGLLARLRSHRDRKSTRLNPVTVRSRMPSSA